ncbi:class I SAM-dependent methyltransferase [Paenibacillus protaetiae]|uniref:Class I SAM-dependent methyltransferase n=1 Tax=Paenibacillus protaetiae TaxID=2509456 RepID=A0A4P6F155_9BACL|nr:class I SAM-dependent methyltransferase [Paenibacillus protaetiae]QAY67849.1 class I SAM-dependent methyltransferase [Paenibacillus protaetiae]
MAGHYYSAKPDVKSDRQTVETKIRDFSFRFVTDAGVFSKSAVDYGSRVLLETLTINPDAKVLDVGCGYGPIGLTAAKLAPQGHVTMIDINERAVELARHNAKLNGIANVTIVQSDLYEKVKDAAFDTILTNPPIRAGKAVVHRIFEEGYERLVPGGRMWVVIQKKQGAPSAEAKLLSLFGQVDEITKDKGYRIFCAVKSGE